MKKYIFGIFAFAFALATVAFTTPKKLATKDFKFIGLTSDQDQVQDPHMWQDVSTLACDGGDVQACRINTIDEDYYHEIGTSGVFELNEDNVEGTAVFEIEALLKSGGTTYYVNDVTTGTIDNKQ